MGWLAIQWWSGSSPIAVIERDPLLIAYLLFPTMFVFGAAGYLVGVQWEKLKAANRRLSTLATRDDLTGMLNARRFWEDFERECIRSKRYDTSLYVLVIDLDRFKQVNDTYGHLMGDRVLQTVAKVMSEQLRGDERLYRVGGEEFAVIVSNLTDEEAEHVAQRLRRAVEATEIPLRSSEHDGESPKSIGITISIGVAGGTPCPSSELPELYDRADEALYAAKKAGRNAVVMR